MDKEYIFHTVFISLSLVLIKYRTQIGSYFKIVDYPNSSRKLHLHPIPSTGGLILLPYITFSLIYLNCLHILQTKHLLISIFLIIYFGFVGLIDDRRQLNAKIKTFFLIIVLLIIIPLDKNFIINVILFKDTNLTILLNQGSLFFTIFCIFFIYNALNFADGANGIALGLCLFWIVTLILIGNVTNVFYTSVAISIFLVLIPNLLNKIFLGNSGVNFLSMLFSIILINLYNQNFIYFDQIILLVFLPSVDLIRVVVERLIKNKSPLNADQNHFHHLLCKIINSKFVFIPYLIIATTPYLLHFLYFKSYIALIIGFVTYFIILLLLKNKNG
jgi:UDP-GlcNAc:undecaprenyl-phosphate GlcNAc-1-phosphate transferase